MPDRTQPQTGRLRRRPVAGRTVLVTGGAGAVGHYAIQLARWFVATASTPQKQPAGAEHVVDDRDRGVADRVLDGLARPSAPA